LTVTGRCWFAVAVLGQWIFVTYVSGFYGATPLRGDFANGLHLLRANSIT